MHLFQICSIQIEYNTIFALDLLLLLRIGWGHNLWLVAAKSWSFAGCRLRNDLQNPIVITRVSDHSLYYSNCNGERFRRPTAPTRLTGLGKRPLLNFFPCEPASANTVYPSSGAESTLQVSISVLVSLIHANLYGKRWKQALHQVAMQQQAASVNLLLSIESHLKLQHPAAGTRDAIEGMSDMGRW